MKKPWSISTTVRNPNRVRNFLSVLKKLEGSEWNREAQKKFQVMLIQYKYYGFDSLQFNNGLSGRHLNLMSSPESISYEDAEEILEAKNYVGGGDMRGRQSFEPIEQMGLVYLDNNIVKISSLGNYFLMDDYDLGEVFFRSFIKWQLPNPISSDYRAVDGFSIKPYIGVLHLIKKVNTLWQELENKPVGISKEEFSIFALSLINYNRIDEYADKVIKYRNKLKECENDNEKKEFIFQYKKEFAAEFLNTTDEEKIKKMINKSGTYTDNAIRYFRLTKYIFVRGNGFYIDLEPRRIIETDKLLEADNAAPVDFASADEYLDNLCDIKQPILPWETDIELKKIINKTLIDIKDIQKDLDTKELSYETVSAKEVNGLSIDELKIYVDELRLYRKSLQEKELKSDTQDINNVKECIEKLKYIFQSKQKKSIELEKLTTIALNALNDALQIKPNYPVGDDNEPTFTAPANKPDIECFYNSFNSICEVTLLTNRSQWYNEGQPVMRHLRDFEDKNVDKDVYCLFVAPSLHRDTINTFWQSVKYEYEGTPQKIIPLTLQQLVTLLEVLVELKEQNKGFTHNNLLSLYNKILEITESVQNSSDWKQQVPATIESWKSELL